MQDITENIILVIIEDITKDLSIKKLNEINNYKSKMLATLSHELRTPLNCSITMLSMC